MVQGETRFFQNSTRGDLKDEKNKTKQASQRNNFI